MSVGRSLFIRKKGYEFFGIVEYYSKMIKDVFSSQKIKTNAKSGRKANSGFEGDVANSYRQGMEEYRDEAAIANCSITSFTFSIIETKEFSILSRENGVKSPCIDIGIKLEPSFWTHKFQGNDWAGYGFITFVGKFYRRIRAHRKSCGCGTRIPKITVLGCSAFALSRSLLGLAPRYILPSATTIYSPAYLSTISSKCFFSHLSASNCLQIFFLALLADIALGSFITSNSINISPLIENVNIINSEEEGKMKIYYRKMKRVGRESEEHRFEPIGPWRLALGGSPLSLDLAEGQENKQVKIKKIKG